MEGMEKQIAKKPGAELPKGTDLSGLSEDEIKELDMSVFFSDETVSEMDNVQYESQKPEIDPESKENIFLAENPDARKVIEEAADASVEFEMDSGEVVGGNPENEKVLSQVEGELRKKYDALVAEAGLSWEAQSKLNEKMIDLINDAKEQESLAKGSVEDKIAVLSKTLEDYSEQIEIEEAMGADFKN